MSRQGPHSLHHGKAQAFKNGRPLAVSMGLASRRKSSNGHQDILGISKRCGWPRPQEG